MAVSRPSTWLITGASSGFGKSLALEALKAGHKVIGTTRDVGKAELSVPEFLSKGGIWIGLDPARQSAFEDFAKCSEEYDIDVLVNNAGYAFIGAVEDTRSVSQSVGCFSHPKAFAYGVCIARMKSEIKWKSTSMGLSVPSEPAFLPCARKAQEILF